MASFRDDFGFREEVTMEKGREFGGEIEEKIKVFGAQVKVCRVGYELTCFNETLVKIRVASESDWDKKSRRL